MSMQLDIQLQAQLLKHGFPSRTVSVANCIDALPLHMVAESTYHRGVIYFCLHLSTIKIMFTCTY